MLSTMHALTPADFPVEVLARDGAVVAVVKASAFAALPFSARQLDRTTLESAEKLARVGAPAPRVWRATCKVTVSLDVTAARHWFLLRPITTTAECFQHPFTSDPASLDELERAVGVAAALQRASHAQGSATYQIYLVSEPPESPPGCVVRGDRVVFGDTAVDVAAAVADFLRAELVHAGATASQTCVCWPAMLPFPVNVHATHDARRKAEHDGLLLPRRRALLHWSQRMSEETWSTADVLRPSPEPCAETDETRADWHRHLVTNPHLTLRRPPGGAEVRLVGGADYDYYHYRVDGTNDEVWGCAYRSLQTILSWFRHAGLLARAIPTLREIQEILARVDPGKRDRVGFVGSREWIGSFEIMLVLQHLLPGLECTILRLESGAELDTSAEVRRVLLEHFGRAEAPPVMIGGSSYAHTIVGVCVNSDTLQALYLVLDPHYSSRETNLRTVLNKGYVGWKQASKFVEPECWYNLCIPRMDLYDPR